MNFALNIIKLMARIVMNPSGTIETIAAIAIRTQLILMTYMLAYYLVSRHVNPKRAHYDGCAVSSTDVYGEESLLCSYANLVVESINYGCQECLLREGSYPVTIKYRRGLLVGGTLAFSIVGISECQITIDADYAVLPGRGEDLRNTILHEIMHCYGIDHNLDNPKSVMYPSSSGEITQEEIQKAIEFLTKRSK